MPFVFDKDPVVRLSRFIEDEESQSIDDACKALWEVIDEERDKREEI